MKAAVGRMSRWIRELVRYISFRRRRRARIEQAKKDDPNVYPLW